MFFGLLTLFVHQLLLVILFLSLNFVMITKHQLNFFHLFLCVKDLKTRTALVHGRSKDDLYEWPQTPQPEPQALAATKTTPLAVWHHRLGHPHYRVFKFICNKFYLPISNKDILLPVIRVNAINLIENLFRNLLCQAPNLYKFFSVTYGDPRLSYL